MFPDIFIQLALLLLLAGWLPVAALLAAAFSLVGQSICWVPRLSVPSAGGI